MLRILSRIKAGNLFRFLVQAKMAYALQYHGVTPKSVLQAWMQKEYNLSEWLRGVHHRRKGYYFLCVGNFPIGYLKFTLFRNYSAIDKLWIKPNFRKRRGSFRLLQAIKPYPQRIQVYAGNLKALRTCRKNGFQYWANTTFQAKGFVQSGKTLLKKNKPVGSVRID